MALLYDSDAYRKSRRHGSSGRRRTTNYDKYGYQVATIGSSSFSNGTESILHVLRVKSGVIVNVVDTPSSSRSSRSRSTPHTVEYRPSRRNSHSHSHVGHGSHDARDSPWATTHSPHPRSLELPDHEVPAQPFGMIEPPSRDPPPGERRSPTSRYAVSESYYPPPAAHYSAPGPAAHYPSPHNSPRRPLSPIDLPDHHSPHSHSSDLLPIPSNSSDSLRSISTLSSDSRPDDHNYAVEPYYFAHRHTPAPIDIPKQISSSERNISRSYEYPSPRTSSSSSNSLPSNARSVRFNEDPVQPSPKTVVRRKGWWNRKGDQLWDNDGGYAPASEHDMWPLDLEDYPEPGTGWMNEEGVRIDIKRRIVRKKPLRSALKKSSL